jgi:methionyl-tRNA formyltransferase
MNTVLLVGQGITARAALESLAERFQVVGVVRNSGVSRDADEVQRLADELKIPVLSDVSITGLRQAIIDRQPDCVVVSSYDRILGRRILDHSRFVNVHYSPLPEYRGRANVNWAIINGEPEVAITIHTLMSELDAGNILFQKSVKVGPHDTVGDLYKVLNGIQRDVLGEIVERYLAGHTGVPQDPSAATYGCTRIPADGEIDWSASTDRIYALIRALSAPYPSAHTYLELRRISIIRAEPVPDGPRYVGRVPGRVVDRHHDSGGVDVLTGDGILRIYQVMTDDSIVQPASAVIRSSKQTLGLRTADLLERISGLSRQIELLTQSDRGPGRASEDHGETSTAASAD